MKNAMEGKPQTTDTETRGFGRPLSPHDERLMQGKPAPNDPQRFFAKEGVDPLTHAFDAKIAVHPGMGGSPVAAEQRDAVLERLLVEKNNDKTVAYIHVPFCETHCLYCGFFSGGYRKAESRVYVDTLVKELSLWSEPLALRGAPVQAVYFGGGTPTALEPKDLERALRAVRKYLPLANDCEITIEGRSSNLTEARIEACLAGGANRFSLGVQSFQTDIRQAMGRRSSREELIERISLLQKYDQAAVIIDLIYGFPMQTMEKWLDDIAVAQSLELDGADCYQLNVFRKSLLGEAIAKGKLPEGAGLSEQAKMFEAGVASMQNAFYRRLSISHWGRTPRERNMYNHYVKGGADCLAFGPGGGGALHGYFYFTTHAYDQWTREVNQGRKPLALLQSPGPHASLFRGIAEDLEQGRLDLPRLERKFGYPLVEILRPLTVQWEQAGLIRYQGDSVVLTLAGEFWQVNLSQLVMEYYAQRVGEQT